MCEGVGGVDLRQLIFVTRRHNKLSFMNFFDFNRRFLISQTREN